ncbi:NAD(+) synthase [Vagococcus penaei]|uniref:NH(3)-dependent NAD(+) synthetase n=1 Tax=Vagococcus penaei TaxID=633807 RepID=A0A1Q2D7E7_9ENTE|nr:ammonia-dependent NAD(+) synthetase [Vagococcus penaei]AQP54356.1 NAD(+) synthase [Vagococcus penaei]RSU06272.1 NAD(+) synthase [Vagococcus penaei]
MREKQRDIQKALHVSDKIDSKMEIAKRVTFLKDYLKAHPFLKSFVLGISGGQDSTLAGKLAQLAIQEMRDETNDMNYQFIAVRLPYGAQNDEEDAEQAITFIHPDQQYVVDIKPAVDALVSELATQSAIQVSDFNKGNIKARQRMMVQYAVAGENYGAVLGTDHAAENVTGFFTKFGDGAADLLPLFGLTKRQGRALLMELGANEALYMKIPTADLEENRPMLADEDALGVTYQAIDDYLEGKDVSEKDAKTIENWYAKTEHKRHLPITMFDTFWQKNN